MLRLITVRLQMVEVAQTPRQPAYGLAALKPFNLKTSFRCRSAAGAAGRHISDNHKSQDAQACIRHSAGAEKTCQASEGRRRWANYLNAPETERGHACPQ
jgi:hypothetical protein